MLKADAAGGVGAKRVFWVQCLYLNTGIRSISTFASTCSADLPLMSVDHAVPNTYR